MLIAALAVPATSLANDPVVLVRNIEYYNPDGQPLLLDAYYAAESSNRPVLLLIHGGSWRKGDKSNWARYAPDFVDAGYTVLVPNYRLAPPGGSSWFPTPLEDLNRAVQWARENAHAFGGDGNRVGMVGVSAGGHLSLLAAASPDNAPDAVAVYSAPVNLKKLMRQGILRDAIKNFIGCGLWVCPETYRVANPRNAITETYPPTFLAYSTYEMIPYQQGQIMATGLEQAGVPHTLFLRPGQSHGLPLAQRSMTETLAFLEQNL